MSRRLYSHNRVRYWYAYDIEDICTLFKRLHAQTVRKWVKNGLKTIDKGKPMLIYGNDLINFLKEQNSQGKCKTEFNQMLCMKCHDARYIFQNKITLEHKNNYLIARGCCRECKTRMYQNYKMYDYSRLKKTFKLVDVSQLYDCAESSYKTHIADDNQNTINESLQGSLF